MKQSRLWLLIAVLAVGLYALTRLRGRPEEAVGEPAKVQTDALAGVSTGNPKQMEPPIRAETLPTIPDEKTRAKVDILKQILASRNDNDPRLDSEFRELDPALKGALRAVYAKLPAEDRNQRGTVIFLLGRSIESTDDLAFFSSVLHEPRCLSLADCDHRPVGDIDEHASMANDVTVSYPQLVAVKSLQKFLQGHGSRDERSGPVAKLSEQVIKTLEEARKSDQQRVASAASSALQAADQKR